MRTEPDVTRAVRSWLTEGADRMPDRVLESVLDLVPTTPQRRPFWSSRRLPTMTNTTRAALAAVAVIIVALGAIALLPRSSGTGGPAITPSPSVVPSSAPPVTPSPSASGALTFGLNLPMKAGTYQVAAPFAKPFTVTFPEGWLAAYETQGDVGFHKLLPAQGAVWLVADLAKDVYRDPCHTESGRVTPEPTLDGYVAALTTMVGFEPGPVTDVEIGGHPARTFVLTHAIDTTTANCTEGPMLPLWTFLGGTTSGAATNGVGTEELWVVDVNGTIVILDGSGFTTTPPADLVEMREVVATIRFD